MSAPRAAQNSYLVSVGHIRQKASYFGIFAHFESWWGPQKSFWWAACDAAREMPVWHPCFRLMCNLPFPRKNDSSNFFDILFLTKILLGRPLYKEISNKMMFFHKKMFFFVSCKEFNEHTSLELYLFQIECDNSHYILFQTLL